MCIIWKALCPYVLDARLRLWVSLEHPFTCVSTTNQAERRWSATHLLARWEHERTTAQWSMSLSLALRPEIICISLKTVYTDNFYVNYFGGPQYWGPNFSEVSPVPLIRHCSHHWWSGVMVIALASINEVNLRRARLVLRWATVSGFNSRCRTLISVCNQPAT